ncbi:hypothetical protein O6H91_02G071700 [Diphasiastrum complanatum]|uniref:Uncharacterized protein n=1 Tax=Diphasiastrum complanatum TaxID=34168 RepID=A0ACC2EHB0_DIPCM|nr:hypothetical protein O6H91_02G071700 [Diphasiastrum complanatum]
MSQIQCPYCAATEGRCTSLGGGRFLTECKSCGRVVEERQSQVEELFVEQAIDQPFCVVTPDFSENEAYRTPPLEDDPFENIGFITAFSTWSVELSPLFTTTSTTTSGHLAELERVLCDYFYSGNGNGNGGSSGAGPSLTSSISMVDMLRAYFQIVEVSSVLGLERDSSDHAIQLFRDCSCTTYLRNRNIEALATAALVQASREAQEPRTLQEISAAANIPQKEIARHMKLLSDALKLSQPINSNSISVHMPRFCSLLQLNKTTQLEDKRKTQTEICKATGLTEVTLRKVYKELLENLDDLLPTDYTPAVPPEKAFPVTAAALGRICATRSSAASGISSTASHADSSVNTITFNPATNSTMFPSVLLPENNDRTGLLSTGSSAASVVWLPGSRAPVPMQSRSIVPSSDCRSSVPIFAMPAAVSNSHPTTSQNIVGSVETIEKSKLLDALKDTEKSGEKDKGRSDFSFSSGGGNFSRNAMTNMMPPSTAIPTFRQGIFPPSGVEARATSGVWPSISTLGMGPHLGLKETSSPMPTGVRHGAEMDGTKSSTPSSSGATAVFENPAPQQ